MDTLQWKYFLSQEMTFLKNGQAIKDRIHYFGDDHLHLLNQALISMNKYHIPPSSIATTKPAKMVDCVVWIEERATGKNLMEIKELSGPPFLSGTYLIGNQNLIDDLAAKSKVKIAENWFPGAILLGNHYKRHFLNDYNNKILFSSEEPSKRIAKYLASNAKLPSSPAYKMELHLKKTDPSPDRTIKYFFYNSLTKAIENFMLLDPTNIDRISMQKKGESSYLSIAAVSSSDRLFGTLRERISTDRSLIYDVNMGFPEGIEPIKQALHLDIDQHSAMTTSIKVGRIDRTVGKFIPELYFKQLQNHLFINQTRLNHKSLTNRQIIAKPKDSKNSKSK